MTVLNGYIGRFAPSPTGPLHAGSLVAALASWLDARAHGGHWLVRIEDADRPRCPAGVGARQLQQLAALGLIPDAQVWWQSQRDAAYAVALKVLIDAGNAYPCGCTRREVQGAVPASGRAPLLSQAANDQLPADQERVYPGTCRQGLHGKSARAWRFRIATDTPPVRWLDRGAGPQQQDVAQAVGDFVLRRADGLWAYQLAVVVDDAAQGVTHVVRGQDLADNTARQVLLQRALGLPTPQYLHTPLVVASDGKKLSKQNGAQPLELDDPAGQLRAALCTLGLPADMRSALPELLTTAIVAWRNLHKIQASPQR